MANLVQRCKAGEADALQEMVLEHRQSIYRLALSILDDPAEAEEAAQDVFIAAVKGLPGYRSESSLSTWLYSITINLCRNRIRRRLVKERVLQALRGIFLVRRSGTPPPEEIVIRRESNADVLEAVDNLGEKHRLPVILYYYHNFTVSEIAQMLDLQEGTVLSRLFTARERLRKALCEKFLSESGIDEDA